jgi:membrane protein required for colicin V production
LINGIDIALILGLLAFVVHGFSRGLVNKLLSLGAILAGIIIAAKYSKTIALMTKDVIGASETVCGIIGVALLFLVLFLAASLLTKLFRRMSILELWDKVGGAIFGLFEGSLMLSLLLLLLSIFDIPAAGSSADRSFLYSPLKNFAGEVYRTFATGGSAEKSIDEFFLKGIIGHTSTN